MVMVFGSLRFLCAVNHASSVRRLSTGFSLFRRAVHIPVGAEHTAIAIFGRHCGTTPGTLVEELSGVVGHFLFPAKATAGTGYSGLDNDFQSFSHLRLRISTLFGHRIH